MLFLYLLLLLFLLYTAAPRGTLLHEATRLPVLWFQALRSRLPGAAVQKMSYGAHPRQYYLFCPATNPRPKPAKWIIYFHGGSWRWGRPDYFRVHARILSEIGYHVILPSYRPCPRHNYHHIAADLKALLRTLSQNHPDWSPQATIAGGMSAGGHLSALLALDVSLVEEALPNACPMAGFFALGAPLDLEHMPASFAIRDLAGPREEPLFSKANPAAHLPLQPLQRGLVVHGEQDGMVPVAAATAFVQKAEDSSNALSFHQIEQGTHLSIAAWPFNNQQVRQIIVNWLAQNPTPESPGATQNQNHPGGH
ncbi:MAG: alpha/beta hydrolase [bacterium]|nr:alpha/beta hydrolase [bacterium]